VCLLLYVEISDDDCTDTSWPRRIFVSFVVFIMFTSATGVLLSAEFVRLAPRLIRDPGLSPQLTVSQPPGGRLLLQLFDSNYLTLICCNYWNLSYRTEDSPVSRHCIIDICYHATNSLSPVLGRGTPFRLCSSLVHSLPHILPFITFPLFLFSFTSVIFCYCPSDPFLPESSHFVSGWEVVGGDRTWV